MHRECRIVVVVAGGVSVTGVLPGTAWRPEGTIAISGELGHLWRDHAGELADVLRLVVERMDACAQQRYAATGAAAVALLGEG